MNTQQFKIGQIIKAFEFEPMEDRPNQYVVGIIEKIDTEYGFYVIKPTEDTLFKDKRVSVFVPIEMCFDWEGRLSLVGETIESVEKSVAKPVEKKEFYEVTLTVSGQDRETVFNAIRTMKGEILFNVISEKGESRDTIA